MTTTYFATIEVERIDEIKGGQGTAEWLMRILHAAAPGKIVATVMEWPEANAITSKEEKPQ